MKIAIAIPTTGTIKTNTFTSIVKMLRVMKCEYTVITQTSSVLHESRNILVDKAFSENCTHILFIDTDMKFDAEALSSLISRDKDIIGTFYNTKTVNPTLTTKDEAEGFKIWEVVGDLIKCAGVGTGFVLINLDVFKKLQKPYFFYSHKEDGSLDYGEDMYFCMKARQAGFDVWVDTKVKIYHIGDYNY